MSSTAPLNYAGLLLTEILELAFRILFRLYGKSNSIFAKKIFAVCGIEGTLVGAYDRPYS